MYEKIIKGEDLKLDYAGSTERNDGLVWVMSALQKYILLDSDGMPAGSNTYKIGETTIELIETTKPNASKTDDNRLRGLLESITIQIKPADKQVIAEIENSIAHLLRKK